MSEYEAKAYRRGLEDAAVLVQENVRGLVETIINHGPRAPAPEGVEVTEADRRLIAAVIDHPSVYMGGPSDRALGLADRIITTLRTRNKP